MSNIESKDISVVVQGAIDKKITYKCLKSIRKYLPGAEIILSTWEDSDVTGLDYDILVLNKDPGGMQYDFSFNPPLMNNCNRQLVSTKNGILKVNRKYCLKLRSDLVLKNADFLNYWDKFSAQNETYKIFKYRVLCSSIYSRENSCQGGTGLPLPFHPSDFWFFGFSEDLKDYFLDCPLQSPEEGSNWIFKYPTRCPYTTPLWIFPPEQFFCVNWVKKYYPNLQFYDWSDWNPENIELSNNILYNNFIFLGLEESGIYSKKHSRSEKNKYDIHGLITYQHFEKQYKNYCDGTYKSDDYKYKLNKHLNHFIKPFFKFNCWISELFSIMYYLFALIFEKITRRVGK